MSTDHASKLPPFLIEPAVESDVSAIFGLVKRLAEYEKLSHEVVAQEADFQRALFGPKPVAEALVARVAGGIVGFALYFSTFSTFLGKTGIYLEDLFVEPERRGQGIGKGLLSEVARIAQAQGCGRLEWSVLTWNQAAIDFYESLGAVRMEGWRMYRLTGDALANLGAAK